jgi:uncharacterized protein YkwD
LSGVLQAVCTVLPLVGCAPNDVMVPIPQAPAYVQDVRTKRRIDAAAAERLINDYRVRNGVQRVKLEPMLVKLAQSQADAMAARDQMSHNLPGVGDLKSRLETSGYRASIAAENLGAGYRTLGEAFVGWRESSGHRENLLRDDVTQLGIALAQTPRGRFKAYWAMIVAAPGARGPVLGLAASKLSATSSAVPLFNSATEGMPTLR